jgi:putative FmdB family regulatory protein
MPTYEYACGACAHQWEVVQRITEPPVELCPACARNEAHRLISRGTNFILKGGGWYSDLYASPKEAPKEDPKAKPKAEAPAGGSEGKTETKTESKPEPKAATTAPSEAATPARPTPPATSS